MNLRRKGILCGFLLVIGALTLSAKITWIAKSYNFGIIKETDGSTEGNFMFVNTGTEPVFINRVKPSCGCTKVDYTHDMIQPGDTASVSFTYDPKNRPGAFDKTLKVYIGEESELHVLKLRGTVVGSPTTLEFAYPKEVGPLRLETMSVKTGELKKGASRHLFINAYNQSLDTLTPGWIASERGIKVELTPSSIPPGDVATFSFYVDTKAEDRMGPVDYAIQLMADRDNPDKGDCLIGVSTIIVPDTQSLTVEEIDGAPRAYLLPEFIDIGEEENFGVIPFSFDILNDGKKNLEVLRVYSMVKNIEIKDKPKKIKPGKRGKVNGTVDMTQLPVGAFRIPIEVMTNDPLHPVRTANLVGVKH